MSFIDDVRHIQKFSETLASVPEEFTKLQKQNEELRNRNEELHKQLEEIDEWNRLSDEEKINKLTVQIKEHLDDYCFDRRCGECKFRLLGSCLKQPTAYILTLVERITTKPETENEGEQVN